MYAYCANNPISRVDDEGNCWEDFWKWLKGLFGLDPEQSSSPTPTPAPTPITIAIKVSPSPTPFIPDVITTYIENAKEKIGTPYGEMDCAQLVRKSVLQYDPGFRRGARYQWSEFDSTKWKKNLGDDVSKYPIGALMYFSTTDGRISHTAIYLGNGLMIDSTDRADIAGVSIRSALAKLTFQGSPIRPVGYLFPTLR